MGTNRRYPREEPPNNLRRHVWVRGTADQRGPWVPGLILEWRRTPSRDWQARVIYVPSPREVMAVERWVAAALLLPVDVEPPPSRDARTAAYGQAMS
ncbi:hypothetical protein OG474_09895 [Kribbella sp. NBC_01505]|uniref:hypothetical protein n=1 Tax=Kribbella sp. NBC_01505 TaxID=2903580 RepID=UPI0038634014